VRISPTTARRLAIDAQLLGRPRLAHGKEGAAQAIERLGRVQIDTISVVARAHHHMLWSRCPGYEEGMLDAIQRDDRRVFEYWSGYVAAYLPIADYRYYLPSMRGFRESAHMQQWQRDHADLVDHVLGRIREEGPLGSADFVDPSGRKRGPWWDWKPAKQALEMLFRAGVLMISERRRFQRRYDLAERVLPRDANTTEPAREETARFVVRRALAHAGLAAADQIGWSWLGDRDAICDALSELTDRGEVVALHITGRQGGTHYALRDALARVRGRRPGAPRLHLLSPFDGLIANRARTREVFGFDCKLEAYTPAAKRQHGYFCLPILFGDRFVGRLDPKADRKAEMLRVHRITFEPDAGDLDAVLPALAEGLRAFAAFNGCDRVAVAATRPASARAALRRHLA
jgi:uncharacterized protein YcaQ